MTIIKTSELTGAALDWAVAKAEFGNGYPDIDFKAIAKRRRYSTDWAQGGTIAHRERISIHYCCDLRDRNGLYVHAEKDTHSYHGYSKGHDEPLIAAMRCYVASKLGDSVEVPDELI